MSEFSEETEKAAIKDEAGYEPVVLKVCDAVGWMDWSPAWEICFHYAHFDEALPDGNGLFVNRQVDPGSRLPQMPLITRESPGMDECPTGCHVSLAALPPRKEEPRGGELYDASDARTAHQRDWDALVQWREEAFRKHDVREDTPVLEKVRILAEYARSRSGSTYASRHPADLFLHASYCVGRANGLAAMLHTMGIQARLINTPAHSVVEVYDEGRWVLVDNLTPGIMISGKNAMEAFADPEALGEELSDAQRGYYQELHSESPYNLSAGWHWHFNQCGLGLDRSRKTLLNGAGISICLDPSTAKALYPDTKRHLFKTLKGEPPVLIACRKHSWYRAGLRVREGQWVRKRFYVDALRDAGNPVEKVVGVLHLMAGESQTMDVEKTDWILKINGRAHNLRDLEGWRIRREFDAWLMPQLAIEFPLPLFELKEGEYNVLEFGTETGKPSGLSQFVHVLIYPDPLLPYLNPFRAEGPGRQGYWLIRPDHPPELRQLDGFEQA